MVYYSINYSADIMVYILCCFFAHFFIRKLKGDALHMTDKELRKLSRLELLELLLDVSRENRKLKEKINMLKEENKIAQNIENLYVITSQVENSLRYANSITDNLKGTPGESAASDKAQTEDTGKTSETSAASDTVPDKDIYKLMLSFFAKNEDKLSVFPEDLEHIVSGRIKSLLERKNMK